MRTRWGLVLPLAVAALALAACGGSQPAVTPTDAVSATAAPLGPTAAGTLPPPIPYRAAPSIAPGTLLSGEAPIDIQVLPAIDPSAWQQLVASDAGLTAAVPPGWNRSSYGTAAKLATWELVESGGKGIIPQPGDATVDMVVSDRSGQITPTNGTHVLAVFRVVSASGPADLIVGMGVSQASGTRTLWAFLTAPAPSGRILNASGGVTLPASAERVAEFITAILSVRVQ